MSGSVPIDTDALVIIADFDVPASKLKEFLRACAADARDSVANEPGCHQFDALVNEEGGVTLLEVYDDADAFEAHLRTPHYATFAAVVEGLELPAPTVRKLLRARGGQH